MKLLLLGPVEATVRGRVVTMGRRQERALLGILALSPQRFVSVDRLADLLWNGHPPDTPRAALQAMVSHLRSALRVAGDTESTILSRSGGYALRIDPGDVDVQAFRTLVSSARAGASATSRAARLKQALSLWRGSPMSDSVDDAARSLLFADVEELRVSAHEDLFQARLDLGEHAAIVADLQTLITEYPVRERPIEILMTALYRTGRPSEALDAYAAFARRLSDDYAIRPTDALRQLQLAVLRDDLALDAPTITVAAGSAPAQLPAGPAPFVGREEQLRRLETLLDGSERSAITVVSGPVGIGKTALVLRWAHSVRDSFPDGQLFIDLRGYSRVTPMLPIEAIGQFLLALGVAPARVPPDLVAATAMYRTQMADKHILVVLDNASSAEQVRPLLPGGRHARTVVTSRDRLAGLVAVQGADQILLGNLTADQSHQLLHRLAGHRLVGGTSLGEADAAVELAIREACEHIPLALRIVAARLHAEPGLDTTGMLTQLRTHRLAALDVGDDDEGAVRAAFDLSYQRLSAPTQRIFRVLGLVPDTVLSADTIAALAGTTVPHADRELTRLTDAHLVTLGTERRYGMHDLLRLYAAQRASVEDSATEQVASLARAFRWYLARAASAAEMLLPGATRLETGLGPEPFSDHDAALAWLDTERDAAISVITLGARAGLHRQAALLADQLRGYLWVRRYSIDWLAVGQTALAAADRCGDTDVRAASHLSLGHLYVLTGNPVRAVAHCRRAIRLFRKAGLSSGHRSATSLLGTVYASIGDTNRAISRLEHSLTIDDDDDGGAAAAAAPLSNLAVLYAMRGDLELARDRNQTALEICRKENARPNQAVILSNLGAIAIYTAHFDDALAELQEAVAAAAEVGMINTESVAHTNLALLACHLGQTDEAATHIGRALELCRRNNDMVDEASARNVAGLRHRLLNDHVSAVREYEWALQTARAAHAEEIEADALIGLSLTHSAAGRDGIPTATQAHQIAAERGLTLLRGDALVALARAHQRQGHIEAARRHAEESLQVYTASGHRLGEAEARRILRAVPVDTPNDADR